MCVSCGLPGHRYGRNEGIDRYDPMACINSLRGALELLDFDAIWTRYYEAADRRNQPGLTEDELRKVVFGE